MDTKVQEIFNPIKGFEGLYEISQLGRVKSVARISPHGSGNDLTIKERILKQGNGTNGYRYVVCRKEGKSHTLYIHRLVAIHFVDNPNNYPQVNHEDGNKSNNTALNLEWCTQSQNMRHAVDTGIIKYKYGKDNHSYRHGRFAKPK